MRTLWMVFLYLSTAPAWACGHEVCLADPETLKLPRIITFDGTRSSPGPGHLVSGILEMDGAVFGERFDGQNVLAAGDHDALEGTAAQPLKIVPGAQWQNLAVVYFEGNNMLNGYGVVGYPKRDAQGEGAIAFMFETDQSALSFQIRGGEAGTVTAMFFARDGRLIEKLDLPPAGEAHVGFVRSDGSADIAGVVLTNNDPQGIALDNIRFGKSPGLS